MALLGAAGAGVGGFFVLSGMYVFVVALVALIRGRVGWARLRTRAAGSRLRGGDGVHVRRRGHRGCSGDAGCRTDALAGPVTTAGTDSCEHVPFGHTDTLGHAEPFAHQVRGHAGECHQGDRTGGSGAAGRQGTRPRTGYSRDQFGQAWFDTDRNGCDTRNDMLRRDLVDRDMKNWCKVLAGTRSPDPYTGKKIRFVLGGASEIDIDHVVPLSDAWQKGPRRGPPGSAWRSPTTP